MTDTETYEWVDQDMFDEALCAVVDGMTPGEILAVPGVYEVLSEALNNPVLDLLRQQRDHDKRYYG